MRFANSIVWVDGARGAMEYRFGRSPAVIALADVREVSLTVERITLFGPIPRGVTVWRNPSGPAWHILPSSG